MQHVPPANATMDRWYASEEVRLSKVYVLSRTAAHAQILSPQNQLLIHLRGCVVVWKADKPMRIDSAASNLDRAESELTRGHGVNNRRGSRHRFNNNRDVELS